MFLAACPPTLFVLILDNAWPVCVLLEAYNQQSKHRGITMLAFPRVSAGALKALTYQG